MAAHAVGAVGFLLAATLLAVLAPWHRSVSISNALLVLAVLAITERVKFPVAGGLTTPIMLAFVPALFLLPTPIVPLIAALALLLARTPELVTEGGQPGMVVAWTADAWFTIGPALLIVLGDAQRFAWSHWPIYLAALAAQLVLDFVATISRCWVGVGISPRVQLPLLTWLYVVDAALAPLGLVIAAAAATRPGLILLALSPMALLLLFARERKERMEDTLALSTAYRGTALLLGDVVEADDHYTGTHSRQVVDLAVEIADGLGLDSGQRRNVEFAALLHDIGKIHIPKEIINKPGPLNDEEWAVMRQHTIDGEQMLKQVGGLLAEIGTFVRASHERWDGSGYPDGLAGDEIPIEARIVSACDAFSAMISHRPYRRALSTGHALAELRRCAGTQFDPDVVAAIERSFAVPAPVPERRKAQPWQVIGLPDELVSDVG